MRCSDTVDSEATRGVPNMGVATPAPASKDTMAAMSRRLLAPGTVERRRRRVRTSVAPALPIVKLVYTRSPCATPPHLHIGCCVLRSWFWVSSRSRTGRRISHRPF